MNFENDCWEETGARCLLPGDDSQAGFLWDVSEKSWHNQFVSLGTWARTLFLPVSDCAGTTGSWWLVRQRLQVSGLSCLDLTLCPAPGLWAYILEAQICRLVNGNSNLVRWDCSERLNMNHRVNGEEPKAITLPQGPGRLGPRSVREARLRTSRRLGQRGWDWSGVQGHQT